MPSSGAGSLLASSNLGLLALVGELGTDPTHTHSDQHCLEHPSGLGCGDPTQSLWGRTFWDAPCCVMGEGTRTGCCPLASRDPAGRPRTSLGPHLPFCKGGPARGLGSEMTAPRGRVGSRRGPASRRPRPPQAEAGALSGYSPRPRRRRLFRASWPRSGPASGPEAAGARTPRPAPAPRARSPATGDGLRSTSHLLFHCGDRGSVSGRPRPAPAPARRAPRPSCRPAA